MSGTKAGFQKARVKLIERFGSEEAYLEWCRQRGRTGGANGHTGGFYDNPERARIAGQKGGTISRRSKKSSV